MVDNHRKHKRHELHVDVQLSFLDNQPTTVCTRDISDGGMFLLINDTSVYPLGEMVHLKYKIPGHDNLDTEMDAIVVRVVDDGIGIAFVELDIF